MSIGKANAAILDLYRQQEECPTLPISEDAKDVVVDD